MYKLHDRVLDTKSGKECFIIVVDGEDGDFVYGVESEDQDDPDWFRWAEEDELRKLPEHRMP